MKISPNVLKKLATSFFAVVLAAFASTAAHAQVLLSVSIVGDVVTINATGALPAETVSPGYSAYIGIDLENFFTLETPDIVSNYPADPTSNTLTTGPSGSALFDKGGTDYLSTDYLDLNLYNSDSGTSNTLSFTSNEPGQTGVQAFSGSISFVMPDASLPSEGTTGSIVAGSTAGGYPDVVIGQWAVAPEPSTWMLLAGSLVLLPLLRRFRRE